MSKKESNNDSMNFNSTFEKIKSILERIIFKIIDIVLKIFFLLFKFSLIFILIYFLFKCQNYTNNSKIFGNIEDDNYLDIICSLLPLIITIVTIAFSLSSEEYYGLKSFTFRKLRKGFTFNFIEMILIVIAILGLCFYSCYRYPSKNNFFSFHITIFSIIYSILFIIQEVPILCKKDSRLMLILKLNFISKRSIEAKEGLISNNGILNDALTFNILSKGVNTTYLNLKFHILKFRNKSIYNQLLILLDNFILEKTQLLDLYLKSTNNANDIIEIKNKISFIIDTDLNNFFNKKKNKNILILFNDIEIMGKFIEMLIDLQHICVKLKLKAKYNEMLTSLIRELNFYFKDGENSKIKYSFLNTMIANTIANEEIWFLRFLLNFESVNSFVNKNKEYFIFLSMYLYYVIKEEEFISKKFNDRLSNFLNKNTKIMQNYPINFKKIICSIYYCSLDKIFQMIQPLIRIRNNGIYYISKFYKKEHKVYKIISFDNEIILDYWMQMVLNKNYVKDCKEFLEDKQKFNKILLNSNIKDKDYINVMNKRYLANYKDNNDFLKFYDINTEIFEKYSNNLYLYFKNFYDNLIKRDKIEKQFSNKFLSNKLNDALNENMKLNFSPSLLKNSTLSDKITILLEGPIKIDNVDLEFSNYTNLGIFNFKNLFEKLIRKKVKIENYDKNTFENIVSTYKYINSNNFLIGTKDYDILEKSSIMNVDIPIYGDILLRSDNSINVSAKLDSESLMVRRLTSNEINSIIESRFNSTYGNYLYYSNNICFFLSRNELFDRISKDFIFFSIECEFEYHINDKLAIIIKKK